MTLTRIRELTHLKNPTARVDDFEMYSHQFLTWLESAQNIAHHGTIAAHARTAQPMENPYVNVQTAAPGSMQ